MQLIIGSAPISQLCAAPTFCLSQSGCSATCAAKTGAPPGFEGFNDRGFTEENMESIIKMLKVEGDKLGTTSIRVFQSSYGPFGQFLEFCIPFLKVL